MSRVRVILELTRAGKEWRPSNSTALGQCGYTKGLALQLFTTMASGMFFSPQTPGGRAPRSGGRPKLGGGLGLAQLSDSLAAIPAAHTPAVPSGPSADATSLLRSVGYHDPAPFALSSLYQQLGAAPVERAPASAAQPAAVGTPAPFKQPGAACSAEQPTDGESDEVPLAYEQMTEAVRKRQPPWPRACAATPRLSQLQKAALVIFNTRIWSAVGFAAVRV